MTETTALPDDDLLDFLGFKPDDFRDPDHKAAVLARLAAKRATYERMAALTVELQLHEQGLAPLPAGVLVDWDRKGKHP